MFAAQTRKEENMIEKLKNVIKRISPTTDLDKVTYDARLIDDLGFDSMSMVMMSMELEEEFGFRFEESVRFTTVGEVLDYIEKIKKKK